MINNNTTPEPLSNYHPKITDNYSSFPLKSLIEEYSTTSSLSLTKRSLVGSWEVNKYRELLLQCFDPQTNTLNLISAQDHNPPSQNPSAADKLAQIWKGCLDNEAWHLAEKLTKEALPLVIAELKENNSLVELKNIKVSENLNTTHIPKSLTNVDGLVSFDSSKNQNIRKIETSALSVFCSGCTSLTKVDFSRAIEIDCSFCNSLTAADFTNAIQVNCSACPNLVSANFPKATSVNCENCINLTETSFPKATFANINKCISLENINLPKAVCVFCFNCTSLEEIDFPSAREVYCDGCTQLKNATLRNADYISCNNCKQLSTAIFPIATTIDHYGCTTLSRPNSSITVAENMILNDIPDDNIIHIRRENAQNQPSSVVDAEFGTPLANNNSLERN